MSRFSVRARDMRRKATSATCRMVRIATAILLGKLLTQLERIGSTYEFRCNKTDANPKSFPPQLVAQTGLALFWSIVMYRGVYTQEECYSTTRKYSERAPGVWSVFPACSPVGQALPKRLPHDDDDLPTSTSIGFRCPLTTGLDSLV
jgi:hypothetical protein